MQFKKIISLLASATMAVTALTGAMTASAISADDGEFNFLEYYTSGRCGTDANWIINDDGVLVISGKGAMSKCYTDPKYGSSWGWKQLSMAIEEVVVEDGITEAANDAFQAVYHNMANVSKVILPPSLTKLNKCFEDQVLYYRNISDIYIYSKNVTDISSIYESHYDGTPVAWHGSGVIWHAYKDSATDKSLRNDLKLTDEDIEYIPDNEKMPTVANKKAAEFGAVTKTSGPAGLAAMYEWDEDSKTLTFSGKGAISYCKDYYEKYKDIAEHVVINSGITMIEASTGVTTGGGMYSEGAFSYFTALKDVKLPDTLMKIGEFSFYRSSLTNIIGGLPSTLKTIDVHAFSGSKLEDELVFPAGFKLVGEGGFSGSNIKGIKLTEGMTLGGSAFGSCRSLEEVTLPKNITINATTIGGMGMARPPATFNMCTALEKIVIEDGFKTNYGNVSSNAIPSNFCSGCTSLKTVIIMGNVEDIGSSVFGNCPSLTDIAIYSPNLTSIREVSGSAENQSIDISNNPTFYVIRRSTTETTLQKAGYFKSGGALYLADPTELYEAIKDAEAMDTSAYTDESVANLKTAIENGIAVRDNFSATQKEIDAALKAINTAIKALKEKSDEPPSSDPSSSEPSSDNSEPSSDSSKPKTDPTTSPTKAPSTKATRSPAQVTKDKNNAQKTMNQAKITSLKAKAKGKKKIVVSWKKVTKAVGYEVQVAKNNKFKKAIVDTFTNNVKLTIADKKIKSKKTYFVRVRAYSTYKDANNKPQKVYSKWIKKVRKVKVK